jgi:hypothetical protein
MGMVADLNILHFLKVCILNLLFISFSIFHGCPFKSWIYQGIMDFPS